MIAFTMTIGKHVQLASRLATLLDTRFSVFGIKFGLDPLLGLVPGIGDWIGILVSFYLLWIAWKLDLPQEKLIRIIGNIAIDGLISSVPVLGDVGDIFFRANKRNMDILSGYIDKDVFIGEIVE